MNRSKTAAGAAAAGSVDRRHWLARAGAGGAALVFGSLPGARLAFGGVSPATAAPAVDTGRLVVVLLRGALDGLAAVPVPGDPAWSTLRPQAAADDARLGAPLPLDGPFALHPSLRRLHDWYRGGELLVVHAVASPYRERSHFDAQQVVESGGNRPFEFDTGWLGRALALADRNGLALAAALPLALRGAAGASSWAPSRNDGLAADDDLVARVARLYDGDAQLGPAFAKAREQHASGVLTAAAPGASAQRLVSTSASASAAAASAAADGGLAGAGVAASAATASPARQDGAGAAVASRSTPPALASPPVLDGASARFVALARHAGRILASDAPAAPSVAWLEAAGWDTHAQQAPRLARALDGLDQALAALRESLGARWASTTVLVITEFGRSALMNGSAGTDHGTAGVAWVAGGAVAGGRVVTDWPGLAASQLRDGRDLRPTLDLRAVVKPVLQRHLALADSQLDRLVLPGAPRGLADLWRS